jgi:hypothetical protein
LDRAKHLSIFNNYVKQSKIKKIYVCLNIHFQIQQALLSSLKDIFIWPRIFSSSQSSFFCEKCIMAFHKVVLHEVRGCLGGFSVPESATWCFASDSNPYPKGAMTFSGQTYPLNDYAFQIWVALGISSPHFCMRDGISAMVFE